MQFIKAGQCIEQTLFDVANAGGAPAMVKCRRTSRGKAEDAAPKLQRARWRPLSAAAAWFRRALRRLRESHELAGLEYRELRDMGVNHYEVRRELERPFWRC